MRPLRRAPTKCAAGLALVALLAGCVSHRKNLVPPDGIDARDHSLPQGAKAGQSIAWTNEEPEPEVEDVVRLELACVAETADTITMERRTTDSGGRREVVATRHARDGRILAAWRGVPGGVGATVVVVEKDPLDVEALKARTEEMRTRYGLPEPTVATGNAREILDTPAGRIPCRIETTRVAILFAEIRAKVWRSVTKLPLTNGDLVRCTMDGIGGHHETILVAFAWKGATPSLSIPP